MTYNPPTSKMMTLAFNHLAVDRLAVRRRSRSSVVRDRMPRARYPGTAGYRRAIALQFDPYPLDDVAPPVAGGRPKEYDRPIPEVQRGQTFTPRRPKI